MLRSAYGKGWQCRVGNMAMPYKRSIRLFLLILVSFRLQAFSPGESQVVTLSFKEAPLQKVFAEIRKQTGYTFAYAEADLSKSRPVNINVTNIRILDALAMVFADQPFSFTVIERVITIKLKAEKKIQQEQSSLQALQSGIDVKGRVLNEREDPVAGVTVQVKGTKTGTATDGDGEFELKKIESTATLVLTAVNIESMEIPVAGRRSLEIRVKGKTGKLDEVQVIAYGKTSQRFNVGNVTTVKAEDIEKQPVNNPLLALQGRVPGLVVTQETGMNGGGVKVRIQGENSILNGNNPLIIIDGIPYPSELPFTLFSVDLLRNGGLGSPLSFVNINDIESIDVLKDADATSIYGSRAANGAILITTKKGKPGKLRVDINLQQGWSKVAREMDLLNTRQYLDMRYEAMKNAGLIPINRTGRPFPNIYAPDLTIWDTTRYTDWQKELIGGTAQYTNYNASLSGGTTTSSYMVGLTYNRSTDVFPGDHDLKSGALHFNLNTASMNQKFKLQLTGTYTVTNNTLPGIDLTAAAIRLAPVAPPLIIADTLNWAPNPAGVDTWDNPLVNTFYTRYKNNTRVLYTSGMVSYNLLRGLDLRCQFGYNAIQTQSSHAVPLAAIRPFFRPFDTRRADFNTSTLYTLIAEPQLSYTVTLGKGKWDILAGATIQQNNTESVTINGSGYTSDLLLDGINGAAVISSSMNKTVYKYNAAFARLGFNWDNKYLISLNGRRDGSSRFGPERRFHNFGSIGLGWIFSEEKWIKHTISWLSFGKLRASYGTTGSDQIGDYRYLSNNSVSLSEISYQGTVAMQVDNLHNPYLQWEETRKWQGGIDLGFWNDRILLSATYARNRSSNQLIEFALPAVTGFESIAENFPATLQNTSWEFMLNTINLKSENFKWTSSVNLTIPRNKVVAFPNIDQTSYANSALGIVVGQPKGVRPIISFKGLDPATGLYMGTDNNGNPAIDNLDRSRFMSFTALYYGGWQNAFSFKSLHIDLLFQFMRQWGSRQFEFWNGESGPGFQDRGRGNQPVAVLDRWQKPGDKSLHPPYSASPTYVYRSNLFPLSTSDAFYSLNASYIRLKNMSISWDLPATLLKRCKLQSGRLYTQAQNLLTISHYAGLDPETQSVTNLPPLRTWTIGLQVGL